MNNPVKVVIVDSEFGDWSAMYVDGISECQGHDITTSDWIEVIEKYKYFDHIDMLTVSGEWLNDLGCLPHEIKDIPIEVIL